MEPSASSTIPKTPIILLDGGLGTTLADEYGCKFDNTTPLWSSQLLNEDTSTLLACQSSFAHAGSECILTATYQASFAGFAKGGVSRSLAEMRMRDAIHLARRSYLGREGFSSLKKNVVLSLGAYGAVMVPSQEYGGHYDRTGNTVGSLRRWHWDRIQAFLPGSGPGEPSSDAGGSDLAFSSKLECWKQVDLVAFETIPVLREIAAVRDVMADVAWCCDGLDGVTKTKDFWISCVFPGDDLCLPDGSTVDEIIRAMLGSRAGAAIPMGIGINCTKIGKLDALIEEYERAVTGLMQQGEIKAWPSLVIYPDGTNGEIYNTTTQQWEKSQAESANTSWDDLVYQIAKKAQARGHWASIYVGGCCKTTPEDIRNLRAIIDGA